MGLMLNNLPNSQQQIESLQRELYNRNLQLNEAQEELRKERIKIATMEQGVSSLREILGPLYGGLKMVFGEIDAMGPASSTPKNTAVWEDWKRKLGGHTAKAIDALLMHGQLNRTQIRIHLRCATGTVTNVVAALNKAGLINKSGDGISLKEL